MGVDIIKYYFSVAYYQIKLGVKRQVEYPLGFISFFIALPIKCISGVVLIYVLVKRFSPLYDWNYGQMIFMYGLSYITEGLTLAFGGQAYRMELYMIRGDFDRSIVRPLSVMFQFIFRSINLTGLLDALSGTIVFVYGFRVVALSLSILNIIKIILVIIGASLIRIAFLTIIGSIAFWTKRSQYLVGVGEELTRRTTLYPISIYPYFVQAVFTFILPFAFISFYPACDFFKYHNKMQFPFPLNLVIWTPLIGILMFKLSNIVFEYGLKVYESTGS